MNQDMKINFIDNDETFLLFEKIFLGYLPFIEGNKELELNEVDNDYFMALECLYSTSKSEVASNWNTEEKLADSLVYYRSIGLLNLKHGKYYINTSVLLKKFNDYENYRKEKSSLSYRKGPKK